MAFCRDFKVPLSKSKITEVFKKCSVNHKPHKIEQFLTAIDRLAFEVNKYRIDDINKKLN